MTYGRPSEYWPVSESCGAVLTTWWWIITRNLNPEFISSLSSWVFQETGVVKVLSTEHYRLKDLGNGTTVKQSRDRFAGYTVKEDVVGLMALIFYGKNSKN